MTLTLEFEDCVDFLVDSIRKQKDKLFIASIHGFANSGQTGMIQQITKKVYRKHRLQGWAGKSGDSLDRFVAGDAAIPAFWLVECLQFPESAKHYTMDALGRLPDVFVYLTRGTLPQTSSFLKEFDITVRNPIAYASSHYLQRQA